MCVLRDSSYRAIIFMANVKLFLTPYRYAQDDDVQRLFQSSENPGDYVVSCFEGVFANTLRPGLVFLQEKLRRGCEQGWWRHRNPHDPAGYDAVRTIGMYEGAREPSICIELNLVDHSRADELLKVASSFGTEFDQGAVHVLFSLRGFPSLGQDPWFSEMIRTGKADPAISNLATYNNQLDPDNVLDNADACGITGLTIDISHLQILYHFRSAGREAAENYRWNDLMGRLNGGRIEVWDALFFNIGRGSDCTSTYENWLG